MSRVWSNFGKSKLQELVGPAVLERLSVILPALKEGSFSPDELYSRASLTQIFDAFSGGEFLQKKEFRKELYNVLAPDVIDSILEIESPKTLSKSFAEKVEFLAAQTWGDNSLTHTVAKKLALSESLIPYEGKHYESVTVFEPAERPYKALKDYQSPVYFEAMEKLQVPLSRFIVQMPTGSGKTRTAIEIITSVINDSREPTIVVWMAHSGELCEQAYESFSEIWAHVGRKKLRLVKAWGDVTKIDPNFEESAFIIGGFQKVHSMLGKHPEIFEALKSRIKLVVVDEAHKVLAPTYLEATKAFMGGETHVVGLTATPGRSMADGDENQKLAKFFFEGKVEIKSGKMPVIDYLRKKKVLSSVERKPLLTHRTFKLTGTQMKQMEEKFDFPPGFLSAVGTDDIRNLEIIKSLEEECALNGKIIFFGCSVEHSKFICALLTFLGIKAAHVDGDTPPSRRSAIIEAFKNSDLQVICNFGVLSTGFDAPKTDVVFISRPTQSIVLYSQMIGRGLRGLAIGGTESCKLVDVVDNIEGFSDENAIYEYFEDYYKA